MSDIIGITMGDPVRVGPEITLKASAEISADVWVQMAAVEEQEKGR